MMVNSLTVSILRQPRNRLSINFVATWVVFLLVVSLTVYCELLAATGNQTQYPNISNHGIAKAGTAASYHHDHHQSSAAIQVAQLVPADYECCVNKMPPAIAISKYLTRSTPDPSKKILLTSHNDYYTPLSQVVEIIQPRNKIPAPVSPPRYLLFHRLLIAHRFA